MDMKLIDRSKFLKMKDVGEDYNEKRGEHPERIYLCDSNRYRMTVLESIWLYPEYYLIFGKHRKPNIWWFLLELWCPWYYNLYELYKKDGMDMYLSEFLMSIVICVLTLCGLGPVFCVILHYMWIKNTHKNCSRMKSFREQEIYEKYKKIKFL